MAVPKRRVTTTTRSVEDYDSDGVNDGPTGGFGFAPSIDEVKGRSTSTFFGTDSGTGATQKEALRPVVYEDHRGLSPEQFELALKAWVGSRIGSLMIVLATLVGSIIVFVWNASSRLTTIETEVKSSGDDLKDLRKDGKALTEKVIRLETRVDGTPARNDQVQRSEKSGQR